MTAITDILIGIVFAAFGQLFFKLGTDNTGQIGLSNILQLFNIYIIVGLVFYGIGSIFWIIALSKADLSFVYPFTALTFVLLCILSVVILKEYPIMEPDRWNGDHTVRRHRSIHIREVVMQIFQRLSIKCYSGG